MVGGGESSLPLLLPSFIYWRLALFFSEDRSFFKTTGFCLFVCLFFLGRCGAFVKKKYIRDVGLIT